MSVPFKDKAQLETESITDPNRGSALDGPDIFEGLSRAGRPDAGHVRWERTALLVADQLLDTAWPRSTRKSSGSAVGSPLVVLVDDAVASVGRLLDLNHPV